MFESETSWKRGGFIDFSKTDLCLNGKSLLISCVYRYIYMYKYMYTYKLNVLFNT